MSVKRKLSKIVEKMYNEGLKDEHFVREATEKTLGGKCWDSTEEEDKYDHIDFWWESPKKGIIGIDVKGLKKSKRHDKEYDDTINWLELRNVYGKPGWVYGKSEYVAFRTKKDILFVKTVKLRDFAEKMTEGKEVVHYNPRDFYVPYQRSHRSDLIIKVPTIDLMELMDFSIELDT